MRSPKIFATRPKAYLETVGPSKWTFIGYDESMNASPQHIMLVELAAGRPIAVRSSVLEFQAEAARLGGGIVILLDFAARKSDGRQRIESQQPLAREMWFVAHTEIKDVPSIRVVMDAVKAAFAKQAAVGNGLTLGRLDRHIETFGSLPSPSAEAERSTRDALSQALRHMPGLSMVSWLQ